jgi:predicted nucleotide-binding protein
MSMKARFEGADGQRLLIEELSKQRLVSGDRQLASEIAACGELRQVEPGEEIIREGGADNHISFIISGSFDTIVRGWRVAQRGAGNSIGEISAVQASEPRSATVKAKETSVLCVLTEAQLNHLGNSYPEIYRRLSQELARRLLEGNNLVSASCENLSVLIVSAIEGLPIARTIQTAFEYDPFFVQVWKNGIFLDSGYPLESFERALERADFAIVVSSSEGVLQKKADGSDSPSSNIVFELGFLMGKLGRHRTLLLEPRNQRIDLPANIGIVETLSYPVSEGAPALAAMQPTCEQLRSQIKQYGPRN